MKESKVEVKRPTMIDSSPPPPEHMLLLGVMIEVPEPPWSVAAQARPLPDADMQHLHAAAYRKVRRPHHPRPRAEHRGSPAPPPVRSLAHHHHPPRPRPHLPQHPPRVPAPAVHHHKVHPLQLPHGLLRLPHHHRPRLRRSSRTPHRLHVFRRRLLVRDDTHVSTSGVPSGSSQPDAGGGAGVARPCFHYELSPPTSGHGSDQLGDVGLLQVPIGEGVHGVDVGLGGVLRAPNQLHLFPSFLLGSLKNRVGY
ncbi:unnamed protein product [Musa acuminata subsp. malaccensis]|uniref:(wild Malaysian banana) hypothetical protein n=1 Tax=Musa acuminata subsp. malaccensis TaxID=214687 RepID=A0A8D7FRG3_MUSAM|nr:unnamed protein product [Musa acuminata subsp. malaccensis]